MLEYSYHFKKDGLNMPRTTFEGRVCEKKCCYQFSRVKTYHCAICTIGFLGLAIGATALAGYLKVGALQNMPKKTAIIVMAAGGGAGAILLIASLFIKKRDSNNDSIARVPKEGIEQKEIDQAERSLEELFQEVSDRLAVARRIGKESQGGLLYGPDAWEWWGVKVVDKVPKCPGIDPNREKILIYVPENSLINGTRKNLYRTRIFAG